MEDKSLWLEINEIWIKFSACPYTTNSTWLTAKCSSVSTRQNGFLSDDHSHPRFTCVRKFCPYIGFQHAATAGESGSYEQHCSCEILPSVWLSLTLA
uniref:Uncharacterized protein n=1 Tax=Oreochromis niloticus TaxID=8128 RepID=A0A669EH14_ORENI